MNKLPETLLGLPVVETEFVEEMDVKTPIITTTWRQPTCFALCHVPDSNPVTVRCQNRDNDCLARLMGVHQAISEKETE